jgi:hypothetical protein
MSVIDTNVRNLNKANFFTSFLTLDGDNNSAKNYISGITEFSYVNTDPDNTLFIGDLVINVKDDGPFNMGEYAAIGTTLSNGINIYYTDTNGTNRNNILGPTYNIKKNSDFLNYTTDVNIFEDVITVNLNFQKNHSNIRLGVTDKIAIELNDDLTNLTEQTVSITGFTYANSDLI